MSEKFTSFDPSLILEAPDDYALFVSEAMKTGDVKHIASAIGIIARAKGMSQIANETGLSREQLYQSFSESGNPTLKTLLAVLSSLGVSIKAIPVTRT